MYRDILLPLDLAHLKDEQPALDTVIEYARAFGSTLHILTVLPDFGYPIVGGYFPAGQEKSAAAKANEDLHAFTAKAIPPEITRRHIIDHGSVYKIILHYSREIGCDLVVMSSGRAPDLEDFLLGPNAARVVRHAKCSVLVVRQRG